jgi:sugar phosphate isomerase/epimerase
MKTRWTLLVAAALVAAIVLPAAAQSAPPVKQPFFAFDNGTGRGEIPPEAQAILLKELGYDGIGYTGAENVPAVLKALDDQGLAMFSTYVEGKVGPDGPKLDPGLKTAIEELKGRDTILWLYITGKADDDAQAVTLVQQAADMAKPAGLRVVLYPHVGFYVATLEDALRVREKAARDNVGVALNLCHFLKADKAENLEKAVKAAGPHLWLVSINGADRDGTDWPALIQTLDRGTFDVAGFLKMLDQAGYRGPVGLQCYNVPGDRRDNLRRSIEAWRRIRPSDAAELRIQQDKNTISVLAGERPVLEYRFTDVPFKPCVTGLYTPSGLQILRDSPHDHLHHHALMYAVGVDELNFWEEAPPDKVGREVHRSLEGQGIGGARFSERLDWLGPDDKLLLGERRTIDVRAGKDFGATLVTWRARLETPPEKASLKLTGRHYFGLGMRFVESMDRVGKFIQADASREEVIRGTEQVVATKWIAYTAPVDGKPVTVALFDHPGNARHPAAMFRMLDPFAYMSATLNLYREPLEIVAGKPLELAYGVSLWDGEVSAEQVEAMYRRWVEAVSGK